MTISTLALAVHNDDLSVALPFMPNPHKTSPCGTEWTVISADFQPDHFDDEALREATENFRHVSVFEAESGEGRVLLGDIEESPLFTYNDEPLDPFDHSVLYEALEGDWSNEVGKDETVGATTARNLFLDGETIYLSVVPRDDMDSVAERLSDLDSRFSPGQSADIHDLL